MFWLEYFWTAICVCCYLQSFGQNPTHFRRKHQWLNIYHLLWTDWRNIWLILLIKSGVSIMKTVLLHFSFVFIGNVIACCGMRKCWNNLLFFIETFAF
jgi:hypothetical protein